LSDAADRGITVTEMAAMDKPIDVLRETTAAFVGRALRGPINEPVLVHSFGDFRRRFGDVWSRSSLGPAVRQFFDHGGKNLYIVRVTNNARCAMICLPASGTALVLRALEPGSTESIRAAVDYDGIDSANEEFFNLALQRIDPITGLVTDQELYKQLSTIDTSLNYVVDALLNSTLVRAETPLPTHRPEATRNSDAAFNASYVEHAQEGSDGHELSDYDLVGSRKQQAGLFALEQVDRFDLLYLPPPGKHVDVGPTSILAAERYCSERGAMLIIDPLTEWTAPDAAINAIRESGYASPNLCSYFPRMSHRNDDGGLARAAGGALAGLLCKLDRKYGAWQDMDQQGLGFSRDLVPAADLSDGQKQDLIRAGVNVICKGAAGSARLHGSVTLGRSSVTHRRFANLSVRRLYLQVISAIDEATRWAVFEDENSRLAERIRAQVTAYFSCLADMDAFENDQFVVECDAGMRKRESAGGHGFAIFVAFQPSGCSEAISFTLHQSIAGSRVVSTAFAPG
jgi:phage tail sheath protein FI